MQQLVQPNLNISGSIGLCLDYARRVFRAPAGNATAWIAWNATQYKHLDQDFPDVAILQWYSFISGGANLGHVTVNVPGVGIYSSPYERGTTHAVLSSVSEVERIYGVKYVGWSEDINGVRVAEENMEVMTKDAAYKVVTYLYQLGTGGSPTPDQGEYWATRMTTILTAIDELGQAMEQALAARMAPTDYTPYTGSQLFTKKGA